MFPASSKGGGQSLVFPDVCKTPTPGGPIPVPYPNSAPPKLRGGNKKQTQAKKGKAKTKGAKKVAMMKSSGDEAGTMKGVVSPSQREMVMHRLQTQGFSRDGAKLMSKGKPVNAAADQIILRSLLSRS